jgi:hypothetical protein
MAALTAPRNTPERSHYLVSEEQDLKTNVIFFHGQMVCLDASGYLIPAITSATLKRFGRLNLSFFGPQGKLDMTGLASGSQKGKIEFGIFRWNNSTSGDLIAVADRGNTCFAVDDNTVAKTSNSSARSVAGIILDVDSSGVWVEQLVS